MTTPSLTKLSHGMEVLTIPMPTTPSVTVLLLGNTGSRYETPAQYGIAHFFEHMVFKGTLKYPDPQTLAVTIDAIGAQSNAFTSKEYTGYYIKAASRHLDIALDVLTDMLIRPLLKQTDIDRERGVIIEEINMYEDTPMQNIGNIFDQLMYRGSGLEHDVIGSKETVSAVNREDFIAFLRQFYHPSNLTLVIAGDESVVDPIRLNGHLEQMLTEKLLEATMGNGELLLPQERWSAETLLAKDEPMIGQEQLLVQTKTTEQVHLMLGWPGIKRGDERRYALGLLVTVLGGNMSSRLFTEVREKRGLCYYVHADADYFHDTGSVAAGAGVDPKRTQEAIQVIKDECLAVGEGRRPIDSQELERAKEYNIGSLQLSLEDSRSVAQFYGMRQLLRREIETPEEVVERLRKVTVEEVNSVAKELLLADQMRLAVIGGLKEEEMRGV